MSNSWTPLPGLGATVLPLDFAGPAHRLAGFVGPALVFGVSGVTGCKLVLDAGNLLLGLSELGGCFRGSPAHRQEVASQVGDVMLLGHRPLCVLPHRPGDTRPLPGGACMGAVEGGFGAAYPLLVGA